MAKKKSSSGKKTSSSKTGAPPRSEPRIQVFQKFGGCNFQMSPRDFDYTHEDSFDAEPEQSDLMPNLMVVQNNAAITSNMTIETRPGMIELFNAPEGKKFTGVATLVGRIMYAATDDQEIHYGRLARSRESVLKPATPEMPWRVTQIDQDRVKKDGTWSYLGYADGKLVGMTEGRQVWVGSIDDHVLKNARPVHNPGTGFTLADLVAKGDLTIAADWSDETPFRITILYTYVNTFGPTLPSPPFTFFASKPTTEWSGAAYVTLSGSVPDNFDIIAVELYYTEGEYQEPNFLTRVAMVNDTGSTDEKDWSYDWTGYLYDTSMWLVANLTMPTENHTAGVPASMMAVHDGQIYFWGGEPAHRIWIGGNVGNRFSVSTGVGGGYVDCEPGVGTAVRSVLKYKTNQGAAIVTALCDNINSQKEYRFNLVESNISLSSEQSAKGWLAEKIAGTVGCKSKNGAVVGNDGLYTISRYGLVVTTMTMEYNSQLQVQYVSDAIEPVFLKQYGAQLKEATLFYINDCIYMTFGSPDGDLDNVIFCYSPVQKAWWTYTLDIDSPILNMIHVDYESSQEGIGIITAERVYLLPTTRLSPPAMPEHDVLIETGELSTTLPAQAMQHLTQLEFRFDHFVGEMDIIVKMIDQFGRVIETKKHVSHPEAVYGLVEHVRVDAVVESYKVIMKGKADMRLTHFLSKSYPKSNKIGMVWGFDSRQSYKAAGSIHREFTSYNDLREAIIP